MFPYEETAQFLGDFAIPRAEGRCLASVKHPASIVDGRKFVAVVITAHMALEDPVVQAFGGNADVARMAFMIVERVYALALRHRLKEIGRASCRERACTYE